MIVFPSTNSCDLSLPASMPDFCITLFIDTLLVHSVILAFSAFHPSLHHHRRHYNHHHHQPKENSIPYTVAHLLHCSSCHHRTSRLAQSGLRSSRLLLLLPTAQEAGTVLVLHCAAVDSPYVFPLPKDAVSIDLELNRQDHQRVA